MPVDVDGTVPIGARSVRLCVGEEGAIPIVGLGRPEGGSGSFPEEGWAWG